ncbi:Zn(2)-C6 fungal-type domain-containing protein [Mycena venus]|uniref:Zn(2)-C6 fungal-type domain-containing protein n=1 Tax=Mycena venus TaxID=2733690 RepID=A0A8H7D5X7_9AGAR|nr:Zn(2)-C6 fungal-type domain-containing protein [Mycena venus]
MTILGCALPGSTRNERASSFSASLHRDGSRYIRLVQPEGFSIITCIEMAQQRSSRKLQLNKGKACFNCRLRKVKCDGKKPICTPCARFLGGGMHDCEYTETGMAQSQVLEEQISIVESRIQELEKPKETRTTIGLHNPYQSTHRQGSSDSRFDGFYPGLRTSQPPPNLMLEVFSFADKIDDLNLNNFKLPSVDLFRTLLNGFLRHASQIGFFLSPKMFDSLSEGVSPGQIASPALLDAINLWGAHLSRSDTFPVSNLLSSALRSVASNLSNDRRPSIILQTIQAEMLLAQYFFRQARILEGKYHATAAVSLALSSGFHKIRSGDARNLVRPTIDSPPSAATPLEEGERINAFWTVLTLNNTWLAADGSPRDVSYAVVDTPWPLDIHTYLRDSRLLPLHSSATIETFLSNLPDHGISRIALHAKAAIVFEQASRLAARFTERVALRNPNTFTTEIGKLDGVIETLKQMLPPLEPDSGSQSLLLVIHSLVQVATIQLHNPFCLRHDLSRSRTVTAAMAIVELVGQTNLDDLGYIDAIVGTLWMAACQVFITEISRAQFSPDGTENMQKYNDGVETLLAAMSVFSRDCRLIELQLETAQRNYAAIRTR